MVPTMKRMKNYQETAHVRNRTASSSRPQPACENRPMAYAGSGHAENLSFMIIRTKLIFFENIQEWRRRKDEMIHWSISCGEEAHHGSYRF